MKRIVRLTESQLRGMIQEAVNSALNEGGHLFTQNDDGSVYTNSNQTYRGVKGSKYIYHGEWSDPEILWKGKLINANEMEEGLWQMYNEQCEEYKEEPTEDGFDEWIKDLGSDFIAYILDETILGM